VPERNERSIMGKASDIVNKVQTFVGEVKTELKKSSWPSRSELVESTIVIIVSMLMLGAFVGLSDKILVNAISLLSIR
jgi:preprotein translocase subunit SecE